MAGDGQQEYTVSNLSIQMANYGRYSFAHAHEDEPLLGSEVQRLVVRRGYGDGPVLREEVQLGPAAGMQMVVGKCFPDSTGVNRRDQKQIHGQGEEPLESLPV